MKEINPVQLRKVLAFRFLKEEELRSLVPLLRLQAVEEGQRIIEENSKEAEVYFILSGTFNVLVSIVEGGEAYIATLGEGESFSESGLFPELPRSASIVAASEGLLLVAQRKDLLGFIAEHPSGGIKMLLMLIYSLLRKLRMVNRELAHERLDDSDQRAIDDLVNQFFEKL